MTFSSLKNYVFLAILLPVLLLVIAACMKKENAPKEPTPSQTRIAFIILDDQTIYQDDFFDFASTTLREMNEDSYDNKEVQKALIDSFLDHRLLLREALKRGIQIDNKKIGSVLESFSSEKGAQDLKVYSGSYETDNKKLAELMRQRLLVEALISQVATGSIKITEAQVKDYYDKNDKALTQDYRAHLLHIFTKDKDTAEKAMAELRRGLSFNEVAERYSEGPEKSTGGDLGNVSRNDFPEIFGIAFKLVPGKISDIVKSDYGYHIFLVKQFEKPKKIPYDNVKNSIYLDLYAKEQENKTKELLDELYKNTKIQRVNDIDLHDFITK